MPAIQPYKSEPNKAKEFSGIFTAIVESSDPVTFNVVVCPVTTESISRQRLQGIPLSHCFASLFGFKDCNIPQPGMSVLCYQVQPTTCYIIGVIPAGETGSINYPSRSHIGQGDTIVDQANIQDYGNDPVKMIFNNVRRPTDVVDGEHVIANDFGVLVALFQQMAVLKGSELAQVQTHLLDDLVRIISHNYQHWTALGEYKIYHDGKALLAEFGATHIPNETYGQPVRTTETNVSPFVEDDKSTADDKEDFFKFTGNERIQAIERFKVYLGRLGDFINAFISIPDSNVLPDLDGTQPTKPDLGAFNFHLGLDGGVHLRSIKEIFIEKVNWIRVPQRILNPEDPTGDNASQITYPIKKEFEFNNSYTLNDNPFLYYLQLRDYVAYTTQVLNYENLLQHKKDFYVNSDITKESSLNSIGNIDPQTPANNQANYQLRTAGIYFMDNGGFMIRDSFGSAIISEGGNIYIQPAKNLYLQPLGSLIGKIGQFVSIAANNDIDFSSTTGGIRYKSDLAQYFYSDDSGIVFQANGNTPSTGIPDPTSEAIETIGGIVFKSKLGIYNFAESDILQYAKQNLVLKSDDTLQIQAATNLILTSSNSCLIGAQSTLYMASEGSAELVATGSVAMGGAAGTAIGQKDQFLGLTYIPNDPYVDPIKGALDIASLVNPIQSILSKNVLQTVDSFQNESAFQKLNFRFLSTSKYGSITELSDPIPQTIAQQQDLQINSGLYTTWQESSVNGSFPYPGADLFDAIYVVSEGFNNLQTYPGSNDLAEKANGINQPTNISNSSLMDYSILKLL